VRLWGSRPLFFRLDLIAFRADLFLPLGLAPPQEPRFSASARARAPTGNERDEARPAPSARYIASSTAVNAHSSSSSRYRAIPIYFHNAEPGGRRSTKAVSSGRRSVIGKRMRSGATRAPGGFGRPLLLRVHHHRAYAAFFPLNAAASAPSRGRNRGLSATSLIPSQLSELQLRGPLFRGFRGVLSAIAGAVDEALRHAARPKPPLPAKGLLLTQFPAVVITAKPIKTGETRC
jgi:hypothetical protein